MNLQDLLRISAIAASVAGVAFFAASEISFVSSSRFRIKGLAKRGVRGAPVADWLLKRPAMLLSVTLVGTNIFVVLASALMTDSLSKSISSYSVLVSTRMATSLILLFGEIAPKTLGVIYGPRLVVPVALGVSLLVTLLKPLVLLTGGFSSLLRGSRRPPMTSIEEIRLLVVLGRTEGVVAARTARIIEGAVSLKELTAYDVMVPRNGVVFLSGQTATDMQTARIETDVFEEQCAVTLDHVRASLEETGTSLENVLKTHIFLPHPEHIASLNKMELEYISVVQAKM